MNNNWTNVELLNYFSEKFSSSDMPGYDKITKAVDELRVLCEYSDIFGFSKHMGFFPSLARGEVMQPV